MASEWRTATVQELVRERLLERPIDGNHGEIHPKAGDFVERGIPFIMASDLVGGRVDTTHCAFISEKQARSLRKGFALPGDVLISHKATMGRTAIIGPLDVPFLMLTPQVTYYRVKDESRLVPRYLKLYFDSPGFQRLFETWGQKGSTRAYLGITSQLDLPIILPPPDEQRAIAHILGTLDDKIELNRRMNETLEAMARALFKSWFVDFDPVRAKAEGRDLSLPKPLPDLFPARVVHSELGEIPEGWRVGPIYDIAEVVYGAPFASAQFNTEGLGEPLIRIRDLVDESPGVWTPEVRPKGYKVHPGDIVAGMDGEFRAYLWGGAEGWLNQRVCAFLPKGDTSGAFVRNAIIEPLADVEATETATTVIHLGKGDIDRFSVVVPTPSVLKAFNDLCQPWYERILVSRHESRTLATLRDTLLSKLIAGELRVKDAESFVGRAV